MAFEQSSAISAVHAAREDWFERAALGASLLCLVHCLALPLIMAALPALSRVLAIPESFHLDVLAFAVPVSGWTLLNGRGRHGAAWPLMLGIAGLALLAIGALAFGKTRGETPLTVLGSLTLAAAHLSNWRLRHVCHLAVTGVQPRALPLGSDVSRISEPDRHPGADGEPSTLPGRRRLTESG